MTKNKFSGYIKPIRLQYKSETGIELYDLENLDPTFDEQLYVHDYTDENDDEHYIEVCPLLHELFPEIVEYINWLENKNEK